MTSSKYVFFKWWTAETMTSFIFANAILLVCAFLYEGMMNYRGRMEAEDRRSDLSTGAPKNQPMRAFFKAFLHGFSYFVSQVLMMVFMLYNGYFIASLVMGRFLGYLFFAIYMPLSVPTDRPKSCCS